MTDDKWIVSRADGKVFSVAKDFSSPYRLLSSYKGPVTEVVSRVMGTEEVFALSERLSLDDLLLIGSSFRKKVWTALFNLTHGENPGPPRPHSYLEVAESLDMGPGVRSVAHAVGLNPLPIIVPCHLIIPKESMDRLNDRVEEMGLFSWKALYVSERKIDYGDYSLGPKLKRQLINYHLSR